MVLKENESTQRYMNLSDFYQWPQKFGAFHEVSKEESVMEEKQYYKTIRMFLHHNIQRNEYRLLFPYVYTIMKWRNRGLRYKGRYDEICIYRDGRGCGRSEGGRL